MQDLNEQRLSLQNRLLENSKTNQETIVINDTEDTHCTKRLKLDDSNCYKKSSKWDTFLNKTDDVKYETNHSEVNVVNRNETDSKLEKQNRIISSASDYNNKFGDVSNLDLDLAF